MSLALEDPTVREEARQWPGHAPDLVSALLFSGRHSEEAEIQAHPGF